MAIPQKQVIQVGKRLLRRPNLYIIITLIIGLVVQWQSYHYHPRIFSGTAVRVIDGDTIVLDGLKIRLQGIGRPRKQTKL